MTHLDKLSADVQATITEFSNACNQLCSPQGMDRASEVGEQAARMGMIEPAKIALEFF
jgi:hypothetical protein